MTRYIVRKQGMPMQIILKSDGAKLLTIKKILKETGCYIYDIEEVELQRTFPIDTKELYDWYNRSARESNMAKHREKPWTGWAAGRIWAAHEAAKIGHEITSVKFWIAEHRRDKL